MADTEPAQAAPRRVTIKDVARAAGVHQSLVSRVVNDDPKASASPSTRQKILEAVEQLGYRANVVARGLRMARTWTLGFVLPDFDNPLYSSIVKGVDAEATALGYGVVLGAHAEGASGDTFARLLRQGRVDGLLVASGTLRDSFLREVSTSGPGPVVLVNRRVRRINASVVVDDEAGASLAVAHLAELGHTTIAGIFGPTFIDTARRRRTGFEAACAKAGVAGGVIEMPTWDSAAGYDATLRALEERPDATALFASTFLMGVGSLSAARTLRVPVPRALSIIAMHDSQLAAYLEPPLTTVAMPTVEMGRAATRLLVSMVDGQPGQHIVADGPAQLMVRKSTARPGSTPRGAR